MADKKPKKQEHRFGFYIRYLIPTDDGIKVVDVPQYNDMAIHCFEQKNMCFDDATSLKFDGKKWTWLTKIALNNFIVEQNKELIKPGHIDGFVKIIKSKCFADAMGISTPEALINVNNGVIDVKTGALLPHSYKYLFKYCAPVDFSHSAECPRWEKFLDEVFEGNKDLVDLSQRLFGYILLGGRPFLHKAFVLYGGGRNGKSTFLDVLRAVIGYESYSTVSMSKLDKEFSLVNIDGMLANIVEETPTDEINAEVFKTLVGGGEIQAAHKGMDEYKFRCNARFVFACNDLPVFRDKSVGLEERLVFIPFNRYFKESERDTSITEKLITELPGIFNWALKGAKTIEKERKIPSYAITTEAKEMYRLETNPTYAWFKEEIEITEDIHYQVPVNTLYEEYSKDMNANGNRPFSKDKFSKQFRKYLESVCGERGITYDPGAKDSTRTIRVFNIVKFTRIRAGASIIFKDSSDSLKKSAVPKKLSYYE